MSSLDNLVHAIASRGSGWDVSRRGLMRSQNSAVVSVFIGAGRRALRRCQWGVEDREECKDRQEILLRCGLSGLLHSLLRFNLHERVMHDLFDGEDGL